MNAIYITTKCVKYTGDSKLLAGFPCPIIFKPYVQRMARMLKLFSILQY
jgi:hypothetical protein